MDIIAYITVPDRKVAEEISRSLLSERLVACTNIFPIESFYEWQGAICTQNEFVILAKTRKEKYSKLEAHIKKIHPYDIPCIMSMPVKFNKEYSAWVKKQTS